MSSQRTETAPGGKGIATRTLTSSHEAIALTTKNNVHCTRYLLSIGFQLVRTRALNNDDIESEM